MSIHYDLSITGIKVKGDIVQIYWTKTATDSLKNKTAQFSGCAHFSPGDFSGILPTEASAKSAVEKFINENIAATVQQQLENKLNF